MDIQTLLKNLSYGELTDLYVGIDGTGAVDEAQVEKILHYANEALLRLYSRFVLLEKDVIIQLQEGRASYPLAPRYARSQQNPQGELPFILDSPFKPFLGDALQIHTVFDSFGRRYPLNNENNPHSLFVIGGTTLQVPRPTPGMYLSTAYQARHPRLTASELTAPILVPDALQGALQAYIGHLYYNGINTPEGAAKAATFLARYEAICEECVRLDLVHSSIALTNLRFDDNGWR